MNTPELPAFNPAPWLPNGHFQTVFASLFMPVAIPQYRREIIDLPDGDIIAADWVDGSPESPLLILVHGMEGSSESRYSRLLMNECKRRGWSGVVLHMRSCGGVINQRRNFYHAGFYQDIKYFIDVLLPQRNISGTRFLAGVSLGGSQVAHYLVNGNAPKHIKAAAMISTPLDLKGSADFMQSFLHRQYVKKFRNSLLKKYQSKAALINDDSMAEELSRARTFWDLDNSATAPLHGFENATHYYREMSAKNCLQDIRIPTLYLASRDDPFIPENSLPNGHLENEHIFSILTEQGGHVGFINQYGNSWMIAAVFKYYSDYEN